MILEIDDLQAEQQRSPRVTGMIRHNRQIHKFNFSSPRVTGMIRQFSRRRADC